MADVDSQSLFWLYQIPNLLLAALMYTLMGRILLALFYAEDSDRVIWRVFKQVTDPVVNAVRVVTPLAVPPPVIVAFAVVWLMAVRLLVFFGYAWAGLLPSVVR